MQVLNLRNNTCFIDLCNITFSGNFVSLLGSNFIQIQSYPLSFTSGKRQNDSTCFNITVIDDMITEYTNYFTVVMVSNDTGVHLAAPINATVSIADSDCRCCCMYIAWKQVTSFP